MSGKRGLKAGDKLGQYKLTEEIGFGGMGVVYRARDQQLDRDVAIKVRAPWLEDEKAHADLVREARMASSLNHPNICTVHQVGEVDGLTFIVMELVKGQSLGSMIPEGGLLPARVLHYGIQVAEALAEAHEHGVIHRDLKSTNVMITADGRAKVLDFGIARHVTPGDATQAALSTLDAFGLPKGTPVYMAPEVLAGGPATPRSDLWALGVLLYEMCAGRRPFGGQTPLEIVMSVTNDEPEDLPPRIGPTLRGIVAKCLHKDPVLRYRRAGEARAALETAQHDSSTRLPAMPPGAAPPVAGAGGWDVAPQTPPRAGGPVAPGTPPTPAWAAGGAPPTPTGAPPTPNTPVEGTHPRRWGRPIAVALLLAAAVATFSIWSRARRDAPAPPGTIHSLAVLPLQNLSGDPSQDFFADGMTEELIATLASVTPLQIISRTSAMRYKGSTKSLRQIARELGVDAVVEGSVARSGKRVRVTAQLIEVPTDRHLWAGVFERDIEDVLQLQGDFAREIAGEVHAVLLPGPVAGAERRVNPEAFEANLRGRHHLARRSIPEFEAAIVEFQASIDRDPQYASAWAGLAQAHALLHNFGASEDTRHLQLAERAADRAIEINANSADAQVAHGEVSLALWKWDEAERSLKRAIELSPSDGDAHFWYAQYLLEQARTKHALIEIELALKSDPLSIVFANSRAEILAANGRVADAQAAIDDVLRLDPSFARAYLEKMDLLHMGGHLAEAAQAIALMDSLSGLPATYARKLRTALERGGPRGYWKEAARQLTTGEGNRPAPAFWLAYCLAQSGDTDAAFQWLDRSLDRHEYPGLRWRWSWAPLRSDPRFQRLLDRMGLG